MTMRKLLASLALAIVVAACGGTGDEAAVGPDGQPPAGQDETDNGAAGQATTDPGDTDDSGPNFGEALQVTLTFSGAVEQTYGMEPETAWVLAGGCMGDQFGLQLQVRDTTYEALGGAEGVTVVQIVVESIGADLSGGVTGTFEVDDLRVELFEPEDVSQRTVFRGPAVFDVTTHDAPAELPDRRMQFTISADDLDGPDGQQLNVRADATWVMGCP